MRYADRIHAPTHAGKAFFLFIFFCLILALSAFSQTKEEKKLRLKGIKALNAGNFADAEAIYTDLLALNPENPDYNYEMGLAIFEGGIFRGKAAKYFEKAILNTTSDTLADMFLYAARAEQHAGNFDLAINYYITYRDMLKEEGTDPSTIDFNIERALEMCINGKVQFENSKEHIRIENMGENINSEFADYSPVVTNDESLILFTSRRSNTTGGEIANDQKYYEDIYFSINKDGQWTPASNFDSTNQFMSNFVNTETHDATITFAGDESQLYIYRDLDVWISTKSNGRWGIPIKASGNINSSRGFEPSIFITQDEQILFVVSDIGTGYGGRDIYISRKDLNGNWTSLQNLGKKINTKFDEDAPFLTPDGNTLYFASNGHNSMGDYDIFKSVIDERGEFSAPENLGPPINTPGHDRYFITTDNGAVGYYASDRPGGYGETDIYRIILDCKAVSATIIRGLVFSEDLNQPVYATIELYDPATNELVNTYIANKETGVYEMRLKTEKTYNFKIRAEGYLPHEGEFTVPQQCDYYDLFQEIKVKNLADSTGRIYAQRATINNAFFNVDKKIEERFQDMPQAQMASVDKDSLRSILAMETSPIEITNYVKMLDILDPKGVRLASTIIGNADVATIQTRDFLNKSYSDQIVIADGHFYGDHLPEARAEYLIASAIKPTEEYPKQQVSIIDEKLKDQPLDAILSTLVEEDNGEMVDARQEKQDIYIAHVKGLVYNADTKTPISAKLEIYDERTNALVKSIDVPGKDGEYEMDLVTNVMYKFVVSAPNFQPLDGEFFIPAQTMKYDLYQEIRLQNLRNNDEIYAQKAIINNAFFNVDQTIIERYPNLDFIALSENQIDSLRFLVTEQTKPIQTSKFVKILDVRDAQGMLLAHEEFGSYEKSTVTSEELYKQKIAQADKFLAENKFAEAHAYYIVAREIQPNDEYALAQIHGIENRLRDKPMAAWLAYDPAIDRSQFIEPAAIAVEEPAVEEPIVEVAQVVEPVTEEVTEEPAIEEIAESTIEPAAVAEIIEEPAIEEPVAVVEEPVITEEPAAIAEETIATEEVVEAPTPAIEETPVVEEVAVVEPAIEETPVIEEIAETVAPIETPAVVEAPVAVAKPEIVEEPIVETEVTQVEETAEEAPEEVVAEAEPTTPTYDPNQKVVFRNIYFDFDKDDLRTASILELNRIGQYMRLTPGTDLRIDGHTDWIGSIEYNLALSERRAQRAYFYLLSEGISEGRLSYQFFGESLPIAPNANADGSDNPEGRQLNRRCEFTLDQTGTADNVVMRF